MCRVAVFDERNGTAFDQPPLGVTTLTTNCPENIKRMFKLPDRVAGPQVLVLLGNQQRLRIAVELSARKPDGSLSAEKARPPAGGLPNDPGTRRAGAEQEVGRGGAVGNWFGKSMPVTRLRDVTRSSSRI